MKKLEIPNLNKAFFNSNKQKKKFLYNHFTKYVVDYKIEGDNIRIFSNVGKSRVVKNTRPNQVRINQTIIRSKIDIANKIDNYEKTSTERLLVLLVNAFFLGISGCLVPLTFFIGNYILFALSICLFSFSTLCTSVITLSYYILVQEVNNLKKLTGYKKAMEFKLPDLSQMKSH